MLIVLLLLCLHAHGLAVGMSGCPCGFLVYLVGGFCIAYIVAEVVKRWNGMREFTKIRNDLTRFVETDTRLNSLYPPQYLHFLAGTPLVTSRSAPNVPWMDASEEGVTEVKARLMKRIEAAADTLPVFADALKYSQHKSGKLIRSRLIVLLAKSLRLDKEKWEKVLLLAQAVELEHCASLLHDDVVDEADMRRGIESVRKKFGDRTAVLTGDNLISILVDVLSEIRIMEVTETVSHSIEALVIGELLQLMTSPSSGDAGHSVVLQQLLFPLHVGDGETLHRIQLYIRKSYFKTASLFAGLAGCVGIIANVPQSDRNALSSFGFFFGLAFQLVDDVLDLADVDPSAVGKPVGGSDVRNGTVTLPVLLACVDEKRLDDSERSALKQMVSRRFRREGDSERTLALLAKSDGIAQSRRVVSYYLDQCRRALVAAKVGNDLEGLLSDYEARQF